MAREIRMFNVVVVQQRLRNVKKSVIHVQSCFFFANLNPIHFLLFAVVVPKLPIVVIQKFCYHSNVTSHFPSLLSSFVCLFVYFSRMRRSQNSKIWTFSIFFFHSPFFPVAFLFLSQFCFPLYHISFTWNFSLLFFFKEGTNFICKQ